MHFKLLKLAACPLLLLILPTPSVHLLPRYLGSFFHHWRRTLAVLKSFMECMPVMAFLAWSRAIENSCSPVPSLGFTAGPIPSLGFTAGPVPSLGFTAGQLDGFVMYTLATFYVFLQTFSSQFLWIFTLHLYTTLKQFLYLSTSVLIQKTQALTRIIYLRFYENFEGCYEWWVWHHISREHGRLVNRWQTSGLLCKNNFWQFCLFPLNVKIVLIWSCTFYSAWILSVNVHRSYLIVMI